MLKGVCVPHPYRL